MWSPPSGSPAREQHRVVPTVMAAKAVPWRSNAVAWMRVQAPPDPVPAPSTSPEAPEPRLEPEAPQTPDAPRPPDFEVTVSGDTQVRAVFEEQRAANETDEQRLMRAIYTQQARSRDGTVTGGERATPEPTTR